MGISAFKLVKVSKAARQANQPSSSILLASSQGRRVQSAVEFNITRVKINIGVRRSSGPSSSTLLASRSTLKSDIQVGHRVQHYSRQDQHWSPTLVGHRVQHYSRPDQCLSPTFGSAVEFNITRVRSEDRSKNRGGSGTRTGERARTRKGAIETNKKIASIKTLRFWTRGRLPGGRVRRQSLVTA